MARDAPAGYPCDHDLSLTNPCPTNDQPPSSTLPRTTRAGLAHPGDGTTYPPVERAACDSVLGPAVFDAVNATTARLGGAARMMTEFGGSYFSPDAAHPDSRATAELAWLLDEADARLESWSFWDLAHFYDYPDPRPGCSQGDGCASLKLLVRPYAQAIAGAPAAMRFDSASGAFSLAFAPDSSIGAPTEIFLPPHIYPAGFDVTIDPPTSGLQWAACEARPNAICVTSSAAAPRTDSAAAAQEVATVRVTPSATVA